MGTTAMYLRRVLFGHRCHICYENWRSGNARAMQGFDNGSNSKQSKVHQNAFLKKRIVEKSLEDRLESFDDFYSDRVS